MRQLLEALGFHRTWSSRRSTLTWLMYIAQRNWLRLIAAVFVVVEALGGVDAAVADKDVGDGADDQDVGE